MLQTRLTELLGIQYPIIQGAMFWLSNAELAAAVSNAGGLGTIASASFATAEDFRNEIRKAKALTDSPFAANINMPPASRPLPNDEFITVLIEEGVKVVETSGSRSPEEYLPRLKEAGIKVIHKTASVKHALTAERLGVDAVAVVGFENGGNVGMNDATTCVLVPIAADALKVPLIAGGGIADGRGLVSALALGADGVLMGTRFLATKECRTHPKFKDWMLRAAETDTVLVMRSVRSTHRALRSPRTEQVLAMEESGASWEELLSVVGGERYRRVYEGELEAGVAYCGQIVGLIHEVPTVKALIEAIVSEAEAVGQRLASNGVFAAQTLHPSPLEKRQEPHTTNGDTPFPPEGPPWNSVPESLGDRSGSAEAPRNVVAHDGNC